MIGQFLDTMIVASSDRVIIMTYQNLSASHNECFIHQSPIYDDNDDDHDDNDDDDDGDDNDDDDNDW